MGQRVAPLLLFVSAACEPMEKHRDRFDGSSHASATDLATRLAEVAQRHGIPGIAAVVVRKDTVLDYAVAGVRRVGESPRIAPDDHFHLGSNAKALTATLLAQLVEAGRLSWSTRPVDVLPGLADGASPGYREITLDQLLTHRAGVPAFTSGFAIALLPDDIHFQNDRTALEWRRAFAIHLLRQAPKVKPGKQFLYSNAGYTIAAAMAEAATGESWESLLEARIFRPLGVTGGTGWPAAADTAQPWGHASRLLAGVQPQDPAGKYQLGPLFAAAGDVHMSARGYARFLQEHLRGLGGDSGLLRAETVRFLHTPVAQYGRGWIVNETDEGRRSAHEGSAGTFHAIAVIDHSRGTAVAVLSNAGTERAARGARALALELIAAAPPPHH